MPQMVSLYKKTAVSVLDKNDESGIVELCYRLPGLKLNKKENTVKNGEVNVTLSECGLKIRLYGTVTVKNQTHSYHHSINQLPSKVKTGHDFNWTALKNGVVVMLRKEDVELSWHDVMLSTGRLDQFVRTVDHMALDPPTPQAVNSSTRLQQSSLVFQLL
ncbi:uncharacterized protein LOC131956786 [Physella acuta]|uniref:uncharacterized protein LOC131956786 n=1 Tax=Physella acuta TaxID=109671 RepID=UPI0027DE551D|nr:uncharacterized protein LOC131956786 [Physella acuta]